MSKPDTPVDFMEYESPWLTISLVIMMLIFAVLLVISYQQAPAIKPIKMSQQTFPVSLVSAFKESHPSQRLADMERARFLNSSQ